jgi:hypothetical protein
MKNDYASNVGGEQYTAVKSSPVFMPGRQITNSSVQHGTVPHRSYRRNMKYSMPRRNSYLHLAVNQGSNVGSAAKISPAAIQTSILPNANLVRWHSDNTGSFRKEKTGPETNKHMPLRGIAVLVFAVAILALSGLLFKTGGQAPFSKQLASTVSIKLYYPAVIPSGYHVVNSSIKMTTSESIHFEIANGKNDIQINESQAESGPDIARVLKTNFQETSIVNNNYGNAVVGYQKSSQGVFGSLVSKDGSWIIATTNNSSKAVGAMSDIMSSLRPI